MAVWHDNQRTCVCCCSIGNILNVTREIDNFFPGMFEYYNVRLWDEESSELMKYWDDTYKFIAKAK